MRTLTSTPTLERLEDKIMLDSTVPALLGSTTVNIHDTLEQNGTAPLSWENNLALPEGITHGRALEPGADLRSAVLSPDGSGMFACSGDGGSWNLVSLDARTGKTRSTIETAHTNAFSVAITPDGTSLVTASYDRTLKIWNIDAGGMLSLKKTVHLPQAAVNVTMSPDGDTVTAMVAANGAMQFSLSTGELKNVAALRAGGVSDFTPDGKSLLAADGANIATYDPSTGAKQTDIGSFTSHVYALDVSPEGRVAIGGEKGDLVIASLTKNESAVTVSVPDGNSVFSLAWIGSSALAVGRKNGQVETYRIADGNATRVSSVHLPNYIDKLMVRHGYVIAVGERASGPAGLFTTPIPQELVPAKPLLQANPLPDSSSMPVTSSAQSLFVDDWSIPLAASPNSSPSPLASRPLEWQVARPTPGLDIRNAVTSPDSQTLFACTGTEGGSWKLASIDAVTGQLKESIAAHASAFDLAISPDGKTLVTGSYDHTLNVWDLSGSTPLLRKTTSFNNAVVDMSMSPDGKTVLAMVAGNGAVQIDLASGEQVVTPLRGGNRGTYTPDGRFLLASDGAKVAAFDPKTGQKKLDVGGMRGGIGALTVSPDGGRIAMGSDKGDVAVIPFLSDGSAVQVCEAGSAVQSLRWIGTSHLAVGKTDGTVTIYKVSESSATLVSSVQLGNYIDDLILRGDTPIAVGEQKNDPAGLFVIDLPAEVKAAALVSVEVQERMLPEYRPIENTELSRAMGICLVEQLGLWEPNASESADAIARRLMPEQYEQGGRTRNELLSAVQSALGHGYEAIVMASNAAFDEELRVRTGVPPLGIDKVGEALRGGMYGPEIYQYVPKMPSAQEVRTKMQIDFYKLFPMYDSIAGRVDNRQAVHEFGPGRTLTAAEAGSSVSRSQARTQRQIASALQSGDSRIVAYKTALATTTTTIASLGERLTGATASTNAQPDVEFTDGEELWSVEGFSKRIAWEMLIEKQVASSQLNTTAAGRLFGNIITEVQKIPSAANVNMLASVAEKITGISATKIKAAVYGTSLEDPRIQTGTMLLTNLPVPAGFDNRLKTLFEEEQFKEIFTHNSEGRAVETFGVHVGRPAESGVAYTDADSHVRIRFNFTSPDMAYAKGQVYLVDAMGHQLAVDNIVPGGFHDTLFVDVPMAKIREAFAANGGVFVGRLQAKIALWDNEGDINGMPGDVLSEPLMVESRGALQFDAAEIIGTEQWAALTSDQQRTVKESLNFGAGLPEKNRQLITWLVQNFLTHGSQEEHRMTLDAATMQWKGEAYVAEDGPNDLGGQCKWWVDFISRQATDIPLPPNAAGSNPYKWLPSPLIDEITSSETNDIVNLVNDTTLQIKAGDFIQISSSKGLRSQHTVIFAKRDTDGIWVFDANYGDNLAPSYHKISLSSLQKYDQFTLYEIHQ